MVTVGVCTVVAKATPRPDAMDSRRNVMGESGSTRNESLHASITRRTTLVLASTRWSLTSPSEQPSKNSKVFDHKNAYSYVLKKKKTLGVTCLSSAYKVASAGR